MSLSWVFRTLARTNWLKVGKKAVEAVLAGLSAWFIVDALNLMNPAWIIVLSTMIYAIVEEVLPFA